MPALAPPGRRTLTQRVSRIIEHTAHALFGHDRHTYHTSHASYRQIDGSGGALQAGELLSRSGELIVASRRSGRDTGDQLSAHDTPGSSDGEQQRAADERVVLRALLGKVSAFSGPLDQLRLDALEDALYDGCSRVWAENSQHRAHERCKRRVGIRNAVSMREADVFGGSLHGEWIVIDAAMECRHSRLVDPTELTDAAFGSGHDNGSGSGEGGSGGEDGGDDSDGDGDGDGQAELATLPCLQSEAESRARLHTQACDLPRALQGRDGDAMRRLRAQFALDLPRLRMYVNDELLPGGAASRPDACVRRLHQLLGTSLGDEVVALSTQGALAPVLAWVCRLYARPDLDEHVTDGGCEEVRVVCRRRHARAGGASAEAAAGAGATATAGAGAGADQAGAGDDPAPCDSCEVVIVKPFRKIEFIDGDAVPTLDLLVVIHLMLAPWRGGDVTISVPVAPADAGLSASGHLYPQTMAPQQQVEQVDLDGGVPLRFHRGGHEPRAMHGSWELVGKPSALGTADADCDAAGAGACTHARISGVT